MKVSELISILQLADPDAEVFSEFEGDFSPTEPREVRVDQVCLVGRDRYSDGSEMAPTWMRSSHPLAKDGATGYDGDILSVLQRSEGVLLWAGQSSTEWPNALCERGRAK